MLLERVLVDSESRDDLALAKMRLAWWSEQVDGGS